MSINSLGFAQSTQTSVIPLMTANKQKLLELGVEEVERKKLLESVVEQIVAPIEAIKG